MCRFLGPINGIVIFHPVLAEDSTATVVFSVTLECDHVIVTYSSNMRDIGNVV